MLLFTCNERYNKYGICCCYKEKWKTYYQQRISNQQARRSKLNVLRKVAQMRRTGQISQAQQHMYRRRASISSLMDANIDKYIKKLSTDESHHQNHSDDILTQYIVINKQADADNRKNSTFTHTHQRNSKFQNQSQQQQKKIMGGGGGGGRRHSFSNFISSFMGVNDEFMAIKNDPDIAKEIEWEPEDLLATYNSDGDDDELMNMVDVQYDELIHESTSEDESDLD
jgi:hypothetical protein